MALGDAGDIDRRAAQVACALGRGDDHGAGGVGLQAAVVEPKRIRDPSRLEIVVHRERTAAHVGLRIELGMLARGHRDRAHRFERRAVEFHVAGREPRVPLHGRYRAVGQIVCADGSGERTRRRRAAAALPARAHAHHRVTVPSARHQHAIGDAESNRHRGALQRHHRARTAHLHVGRVAQVLDSEVGGKMFGRGAERRPDDAVDVVGLQARVVERLGRSFEHQLQFGLARAARERALAHADDARFVFQ